jgi:hypothetical protein
MAIQDFLAVHLTRPSTARRASLVDAIAPAGAWGSVVVRFRAVDLDALADLKLPDADGAMHRLGDTWRDRPIVLVFLRHFG